MRIRVLCRTIDVIASEGEVPHSWARMWSRCIEATPTLTEAQPDEVIDLATIAGPNQSAPSSWESDGFTYDFVSRVTLDAIHACGGKQVMLHAAALAEPESGQTLVLVAPSGTGKTTACARLCVDAFAYVTDETVVIDDNGLVHRYEKPLSLRAEGDPIKRQFGPDELGLQPPPNHDLQLAAFVVLDRTEAAEPTLEHLARAEGLLALVGQSSALPVMDDPLSRLDALVSRAGGVWRLTYSDIADASALLAGLVHHHEPQAPAEHLPPNREQRGTADYSVVSSHATVPDAEFLVRGAYTDAVAFDDQVLALVGASPCLLSGIGATIWRTAEEPRSIEQLVTVVVEEFGEHPNAKQLVEGAITELYGASLLREARSLPS